MKGHKIYIIIGFITGISFLLTLVNAFSYFLLENGFAGSYPSFYVWLVTFLQFSQEPFFAIFRIPGVILFSGILIYFVIFFAFILIRLLFLPVILLLEKRKKKEKNLTKKSFKSPSVMMFLKWLFVLAFYAAHIYFFGYYLNDILHPGDVYLYYVIFYIYGCLCAVMVNILFNISKPLKSSPFFELGGSLLLVGAAVAAYFFIDKYDVSLSYYIHSCVILLVFILVNAFDIASMEAERCPKCGGKCFDELIKEESKDLGESYGFETCSRKVGTRETTVTISDESGHTIASGTGSEDIYEDYDSMYTISNTLYTYTYDSECVHCHHHHTYITTSTHSSRY